MSWCLKYIEINSYQTFKTQNLGYGWAWENVVTEWSDFFLPDTLQIKQITTLQPKWQIFTENLGDNTYSSIHIYCIVMTKHGPVVSIELGHLRPSIAEPRNMIIIFLLAEHIYRFSPAGWDCLLGASFGVQPDQVDPCKFVPLEQTLSVQVLCSLPRKLIVSPVEPNDRLNQHLIIKLAELTST